MKVLAVALNSNALDRVAKINEETTYRILRIKRDSCCSDRPPGIILNRREIPRPIDHIRVYTVCVSAILDSIPIVGVQMLNSFPLVFFTKEGINYLRLDRKSTRLNSSHSQQSRMPSSA